MAGTTEVSTASKELADLRKLALDIKSLLNSQKDTLAKAKLSMPPRGSQQQELPFGDG